MENITGEKEMIQTSLFPQLEKSFPQLEKSLLYKIRYVHLKTGLVLKGSFYLEGGKKIGGRAQYLYNSEWVYKEELPVERQNRRLRESSLKFFMLKLKESMKSMNTRWKKAGRKPLGVNEFEDKWNCADKVNEQFSKQVEKYGYKCPITHIDFTTIRKQEKKRRTTHIISNISADRLLDRINYTKQNVLFTSVGWNIARQNFSLKDIEKLFPSEFAGRYGKIVRERFPNINEGSADV